MPPGGTHRQGRCSLSEHEYERYGFVIRRVGEMDMLEPDPDALEPEDIGVLIRRATILGMRFDDPVYRNMVTNYNEWLAERCPTFELAVTVSYDLSGFGESDRQHAVLGIRRQLASVGEFVVEQDALTPARGVRIISATFKVKGGE